MASAKWRPFCLDLNVLTRLTIKYSYCKERLDIEFSYGSCSRHIIDAIDTDSALNRCVNQW